MTSFKLGLLVLAFLLAAAITAIVFGVRGLREDSVEYHVYFDESVQGLDVGAPVKYRGITLGDVARIHLAPDRRHVDVVADLSVATSRELGLADSERPDDAGLMLAPELRAELGTQGITGVRFVNLDFAPVGERPPASLPFEPHPNHVLARTSFLAALERDLRQGAERAPELVDAAVATLRQLQRVAQELEEQRLPARAGRTLDEATLAFREVRAMVHSVDRAQLPEKTARALEGLDAAAASLQRASDAVGDVGRSAAGSADDLERTLRDVGEAARAIRTLADLLEREPDALVNGRAPRSPP